MSKNDARPFGVLKPDNCAHFHPININHNMANTTHLNTHLTNNPHTRRTHHNTPSHNTNRNTTRNTNPYTNLSNYTLQTLGRVGPLYAVLWAYRRPCLLTAKRSTAAGR